MDHFLAFRCVGNFAWPPVTSAPKTGFREGLVEIHYLRNSSDKWVACVRWVPKRLYDEADVKSGNLWKPLGPGELQLDELPQLLNASDGALVKGFMDGAAAEDPADEVRMGRFDEANSVTGSFGKLRFEGAHLLEQFTPAATAEANALTGPVPSLRLPLVRDHQAKESSRDLYSSLQIGRADWASRKQFQLDLALPSPLPTNSEQWEASQAFFGISATFDEKLGSEAVGSWSDGPLFESLMYGFRKNNSKVKPSEGASERLGSCDFPVRKNDPHLSWLVEHALPAMGFPVVSRSGQRAYNGFVADECGDDGHQRPFPGFRIEATERADSGSGPIRGFAIHQRFALAVSNFRAPIQEDESDVRVRDDGVQFRVHGQSGQWVSFGERFYAATILRGHVEDKDVWTNGAATADRVDVMVGSEQSFDGSWTRDYAPGNPANPNLAWMVQNALAAMRSTLTALRQTHAPQPQSVLPMVGAIEGGGEKLKKHFGLFARTQQPLLFQPGLPLLDLEETRQELRDRWGSLQTHDVAFELAVKELTQLQIQARWPSWDPSGATNLSLVHHAVGGAAGKRFLTLKLENGDEVSGLKRAALGGFSFAHHAQKALYQDDDKASKSDASVLRIGVRPAIEGRTVAAADIQLDLHFMISRVDAAGVDRPRFDRTGRSQPLIMRRADNESGDFSLLVSEKLGEDDEWRLTAQLLERVQSTQTQAQGRVLLSEEPFAFQRFHSQPLEARGNQESVIVATYDSDTGVWQLKQVARVYGYTLPPQSIGESMDKPRRLELHDVEPTGADESRRPYPPEPDNAAPDGLSRRAVEFRLTPPANLWIRPGDVQRSYVPPEWASREIFRQRDELGLGAALDAFRGEFVYGLSVGIRPDLERGPSRRARVAEIEALTGQLIDKAPDDTDGLEGRWAKLHKAFQRRPERLEFWADDPDRPMRFAPARFTLGASFALRTSALHRPAVLDLEPSLSGGPGKPSQRVPGLSPRLHPLGLSGGALWPIESRNVLNMVLDAPSSNGGSIESVALSPLGGDADQAARFCGNRVSIITETRGGYVQRQRVEVIGRVGAFWHRAKHVVVYERTANPSAQFAPGPNDMPTDRVRGPRTRRPVLRKVSEFIEILQHERRYPDFPNVDPQTRAFLRGMRFNNPVIPVDSLWGEDVGDVGWKVPLWNRYAAAIRPQVYRKPDIAFLNASEGPQKDAECSQGCLNPEDLWFFTDTTPGATDDTDAWAAVLAVDWTNMSRPMGRFGPPQDESSKAHEAAERGSAPRVPQGYAGFTWLMAPPAQRSAVNEARGKDPVYAALESLTFMRAGPAAPKADNPTLGTLVSADELAASLPGGGGYGLWMKGQALVSGPQPLVKLSDLMAKLQNMPRDQLPDAEQGALIKTALMEVEALMTALPNSMMQAVNERFGALQGRQAELKQRLEGINAMDVLDDPKICQRLIDGLTSSITAKRLAIMQEVQAWEAEVSGLLDAPGLKFSKNGLVDALYEPYEQAMAPVFSAAAVEVGKLHRGFETARGSVAEVRVRLKDELQLATRGIVAARQAIDAAKPWSPRRVEDFRESLVVNIDRAQAQAAGVVGDACSRLSTGLDRLAQGIGSVTALALKQVLLRESALKKLARPKGVDERIADLEDLGRSMDEIIRTDGALDKLKALAEKHKDKLGATRQAIDDAAARVRTQIEVARGNLALIRPAHEKFANVLEAAVKAAAGDAAKALDEAQVVIDELLKKMAADIGHVEQAIREEIEAGARAARMGVDAGIRSTLAGLHEGKSYIDQMVADAHREIERCVKGVDGWVDDVSAVTEQAILDARASVAKLEKEVGPDKLQQVLNDAVRAIIEDGVVRLANWPDPSDVRDITDEMRSKWRLLLSDVVGRIDAVLREPGKLVGSIAGPIQAACEGLSDGIADAKKYLEQSAKQVLDDVLARFQAKELVPRLDEALGDMKKYRELVGVFNEFERDARRFGNDLAAAGEITRAWGDNVVTAVGNLGKGGVLAVPGNVLRALAAYGSGPELPNLELARARIGYYFDELSKVVDITPVEAYFGRMGDGLKALGLCLPVSGIEGSLKAVDTSMFDIGYIVRKCGGAELERMCRGYPMPKSMRDAVHVTHGFDKKSMRAWVQVDMNVKLEGRRSLFSVGPFTLDILNASLIGKLSINASEDGIKEDGSSTLQADFAAVVGGQTMVTLQNVAVNYDKANGLQVSFDAKNIKLNPGLQFIQNTLGSIIGDEIGGLRIIKENGLPVGLEHLFTMPPMSLMFGTSGVQNIQINNQFQLIAYPDFLLSNRFSLAKPELPFLFTVFIIGGTGWLTVDVEYRPFRDELMVVVDAGAGGSASLAFAFAGCVGSVAITISIALTYRKLIGRSGGGLTISAVVLIVGLVDVLRIASACVTVMMRLAYSENGDINATGSFNITIRISRFFKISAGGQAQYRMSGGKSESSSSSSVSAGVDYQKAQKLANGRKG